MQKRSDPGQFGILTEAFANEILEYGTTWRTEIYDRIGIAKKCDFEALEKRVAALEAKLAATAEKAE